MSRFIGDPVTRLGFGILWCSSCKHGARLSRVRVPEALAMRGWDDDNALAGVPEIEFDGT